MDQALSAQSSLPPVVDYPAFHERAPWLGGDLQTLRNFLLGVLVKDPVLGGERLALALNDGTGDALSAALHRPEGAITKPLVVLIHGLTGCEDSSHVIRSTVYFLGRGYPVLRLNLRGAGPSRPLCRSHYHAGRSEDLAAVLTTLQGEYPDVLVEGICPIGYSLGGNMLLKFMAELDGRLPIRAAASVCAPIDLKEAQVCMTKLRNRLCHDYLLRRMRAEALAGKAEVDASTKAKIQAAKRIYDFDNAYIAPLAGFASADDYYTGSSAQRFLAAIHTPTLVVHARNDPWIPVDSYDRYPWSENPNLKLLLPAGGGHVGFHGQGSKSSWYDLWIEEFFEAVARSSVL